MPVERTNTIDGLSPTTSPPFNPNDLAKRIGIAGKIALAARSLSSGKYEAYCAMAPGFAASAGMGFSGLPFLRHVAQIVIACPPHRSQWFNREPLSRHPGNS